MFSAKKSVCHLMVGNCYISWAVRFWIPPVACSVAVPIFWWGVILVGYLLLESLTVLLKRYSLILAMFHLIILQGVTLIAHILYHQKQRYITW